MNQKDFIDMSKRMVVEYYNRYVHNAEPDLTNVKIDTSFIDILNMEEWNDGRMEVTLQVIIDLWIEYHVVYNPESEDKISSFIALS